MSNYCVPGTRDPDGSKTEKSLALLGRTFWRGNRVNSQTKQEAVISEGVESCGDQRARERLS